MLFHPLAYTMLDGGVSSFPACNELTKLDSIQVYIITGGSAGIGYGIVRGLLSKNASKIIFLSANDVNGRISLATAQDELTPTDRDRVEWVQCDFADLKDTDRVSCELRDRFKDGRLDGVSPRSLRET